MLNNSSSEPIIIAIVGMPGSGKSETAFYLKDKGLSLVRFGDVTEEGLAAQNLPVTPENEEAYRNQMREDMGMAAYAVKSEEKVAKLLESGKDVVIDGLYSWEEYLYLKKRFPQLLLLHIFARPNIRYGRLASRTIRPFTREESYTRDISEIERLNKGGPIAMADYQIVNESDKQQLHNEVDALFQLLTTHENIN